MAENYSVGFTLKSSFDGTGTQQAQQALNGVTQTAGKTQAAMASTAHSAGKMSAGLRAGAASAGALAGALGQGAGGAAVAARSLGAVLAGLAGGPVGLVIAGIAAITATIGYFKGKAKEAKEEFEKGVQSFQKLQGERVAANYKRIADAIDATAKAQQALNASVGGYRAGETALGMAQIDRDTQASVSSATGEQAKAEAAQAGEIRKAEFLASRKKQEAEIALAQATEDLATARKKEAVAYDAWQKAQRVADKSGGEAKVANNAIAADMRKAYEEAQTATRTADQQAINAKLGIAVVAQETANVMQTARDAQKQFADASEQAASLAEIEALEAESARAEHAANVAKQQAAEKAITDKKQAIAQATEEEKQAAEDRARRARIVDAAKNMSPDQWNNAGGKAGIESGLNPDQQKARDKAEADAKKRDARNADKVARGVKLSDSEKEWWRNYKELKWARDMGVMDNAAERQAKEQAEVMAKQLTQLEKIATNLTKTLTESGGN